MKVYLSGPIYPDNKEATDEWRRESKNVLIRGGIWTIDPCRNKAIYTYGLYTPNEIVFRDLKDVDESDMILANFMMVGDKLPIGTVMEIMYAWEHKKPVVIVSTDPRIITHPWLLAMSVRIYPKLQEALDYIVGFWGEE
jgi:nucleoside 2-deoxyribosyltransferase